MGIFSRRSDLKHKADNTEIDLGRFAQRNPFELINSTNAVIPNYDLSGREFHFNIYLHYTQEICIMGTLDNNYICGLSFSSVSDLVRTQAIIDGMANSARSLISTQHKILGERCNDVRKWYRLKLSQEIREDETLYLLAETGVHFPLNFMSKQIETAFSNLLKACEARLAGGNYLSVLQNYLEILTKYARGDAEAADHYLQVRPLINIVQTEDYLKLSSSAEVRNLFLSLEEGVDGLYGAYMDKYR